MKSFITILISCITMTGFGQKVDTLTTISLESVMVTAYKEKPTQETSLNIATLKIDSLSQYGNFNLTDLMAKTPGVRMLSTGLAISKPVIRGLYGNRVLVLLSGLKFDNQQWQEEHGLGLSDLGISKVEIIKGPMSILYGTEAIGGIINVLEEEKPSLNTQEEDISLKFNSNTLGGLLQAGIKANYGKKWWRLRAGIENHADYSDGEQNRVLNSRFDGYSLKASYGFQHKNWTSTNNLLSSFNRSGFIFNDIYDFVSPDDRWSRKLDVNPSHLVLLNILSSENKFILKNNSILHVNAGIQSNERMENEGGGAISLNMHLLTFQYLLKWEKQLSVKHRLILSHLGSFEDNTNFGSRKIVPDATMQESNVSAYLETTFHDQLILENGVGVGEKWIKTYFTSSVNGPEKEVHPFSKFSPYYNFFTGLSYFPNPKVNLKFNAATGVRIPNLAELSSNGLHEGVFTYEIGDPDLKNEQNFSFNLLFQYTHQFLEWSVSPFYNFFTNYVYLAPTDEEYFGFPVYRFQQQNAQQYGSELSLTIKPASYWNLGIAYSGMISKTQDGNHTPFTPAQKISPKIHYSFDLKKGHVINFFTEVDYYFSQNNTAPFEIATPEYYLWNMGISTTFKGQGKLCRMSLVGHNLLNTAYYDHLSRFKYFDLLNIGRNISLTIKLKFDKKISSH